MTTSFLTVRQMAEKHQAFSEASLRYLIFNARENNLAHAIYRVGRKILINEKLFIEWVEKHKGAAL